MDWLRVFIAVYSVLFLLGVVFQVASIGKPRKPSTAAGVGCAMLIYVPMFVALLLVWQRLG